jgi:hypothetical protein
MENRGAVVRFPAGARDFSFLRNIHTVCGYHPVSFCVPAAPSLVAKRQEREADQSSPTNVEVNECRYTSAPPCTIVPHTVTVLPLYKTCSSRGDKTYLSGYHQDSETSSG